MDDTDQRLIDMENQVRESRIIADEERLRNIQSSLDSDEKNDKSMLAEQLDLSYEKQEIYYHLRGFILVQDEDGDLVWKKDPNNDLSFLTEEGINYCFWVLSGYLNKNILLGNYEEDAILNKMQDIGHTLNDTLFTKSNKYFKEPTLEECKKEIEKNIKKKVELRKFAFQLTGRTLDETEARKEIIKEMEGTIEEELEKIKRSIMNQRYRMLNSLIIWMLDQIHGAYQRAWKGQERRTLREHIHISETKGGMLLPQRKESFLDKFRG